MQKEEWIDKVLESTKGLQKVSPGPFLFEKIVTRIEHEKQHPFSSGGLVYFNWKFLAAASCLIIINTLAIRYYINNEVSQRASEDQVQNASVSGTDYNYSTTYSY